MSFSDIRDQAVPVRLLRSALKSGRIPNGLLFYGPEGIGKRLAALELAKAINCHEAQADACGACLSCRKIAHGNHADVKVIMPSGKSRIINVETVDMMAELSAYRPFEGAWRVFVIEDADRMGLPAQNHFLKTLEEPPSATVFVLMTQFPKLLLPTIRSRCQQVRFGALRPETVKELLLRDRDLPPESAMAIAAVSQGQMSRALDLVETEKRPVVLSVAARLASGEDPMALSEEFVKHLRAQGEALRASVKAEADDDDSGVMLDDLSREEREEQKQQQLALAEALLRRDIMEYLYLFKTWYRDQMVLGAAGNPAHLLNRDHLGRLEAAASERIEAKLAAIDKAWRYVERNLSMERVFRDLFFTLAA